MKAKDKTQKRISYLTVKISLTFILVLSVVFGLYAFFSIRESVSTIDAKYKTSALSTIETVNAYIDGNANMEDIDGIQQMCDSLVKFNKEITKASLYVKQEDGKVIRIASSDHKQIGTEASREDINPINMRKVTWSEIYRGKNGHMVEILAPIYIKGEPKASFGVYMDLKQKDIAVRHYVIRAIIYAFAALLAMILILYTAFRQELFKPLSQLAEGAREIAIGNRNKRIRMYRNDELGELAEKIDSMSDALQLKEEKLRMERELKRSLKKLQRTFEGTVLALASTAEKRDPYTAGHQQRVAKLACSIAAEMGLEEDIIDGIRVASTLHDIGKLSIPSEILTKPRHLNDIEFSIIKTHSQEGFDILKAIDFPWPVADIIMQHHERMDGSGYPFGLSGNEILLEARILAVADVVEAMASHRPYRAALGIEEALNEILMHRGTLYDPQVVDACIALFKQRGFKLDYIQTAASA
ncbi:MAG: HD domain-containing phosphohydrolase [Actinomycetota bacterium]